MSDIKRLIDEDTSSPVSRALLKAGREVVPSAESRAKLLSALGVGLATGTAALVSSGSAKAATTSSFLASTGGKVGLVIACALAGGTGLYAVQEGTQAPGSTAAPHARAPQQLRNGAPALAPPPIPAAEKEVGAPAPEPGASSPSSERSVRAEPPERAERVPRGVVQHSRARSNENRPPRAPHTGTSPAPAFTAAPVPHDTVPSATVDARLAEELRYLDAARSAVQSGDGVTAEQRLAQYFERFPNGFLRPEAEQLLARARATSDQARP